MSPLETLREDERLRPQDFALFVDRWCDGSEPCAVETEPHGHWRFSRKIPFFVALNSMLDAAYARGAEKMRDAVADLFEGTADKAGLASMPAWAKFIRTLPLPEETK